MKPILPTTRQNLDARLLQWTPKYMQIEHELAMIIDPEAWEPIPRHFRPYGAGTKLIHSARNRSLSKARSTLGGYWAILCDVWMMMRPTPHEDWALVRRYRSAHPELQVNEWELRRYLYKLWRHKAYHSGNLKAWPIAEVINVEDNLPPGNYEGQVVGVAMETLKTGQPVMVMDFEVHNSPSGRFIPETNPIRNMDFSKIEERIMAYTPNHHTYKVVFIDGTNDKKYGYTSPSVYKEGEYVLIDSPLTGRTAPAQIVETYYNTSMGYTKSILGSADPAVYADEIRAHEQRAAERIRAHKRRELIAARGNLSRQITDCENEVRKLILDRELQNHEAYQVLMASIRDIDRQISEIGN